MGDEVQSEDIELTDEMLEAIRILRSDGHTRQLEELKQSHAEIISRLNEVDKVKDASGKESEIPEGQGEASNPPASNTPALESPQPPPKVEPPVVEPKAGKIPWWERETYSKG